MGAVGPVVVAASRGTAVMAPRAGGHVSTVVRPGTIAVHRTRTTGTPNRNVRVASNFNLPIFPAAMNVPGLGFDYPHLAAVNPQRGQRRSGFGRGVPLGFGGFLFSSPEIVVENPQAVEEAQQSAPEDTQVANTVADDGRDSERGYLPRTRPVPAAPPEDAAQYVFVRRDGGLLFAVAYSWENGTLRYVTPEGLKKSITQDALDMDATQQFNEQRGLKFRVPA